MFLAHLVLLGLSKDTCMLTLAQSIASFVSPLSHWRNKGRVQRDHLSKLPNILHCVMRQEHTKAWWFCQLTSTYLVSLYNFQQKGGRGTNQEAKPQKPPTGSHPLAGEVMLRASLSAHDGSPRAVCLPSRTQDGEMQEGQVVAPPSSAGPSGPALGDLHVITGITPGSGLSVDFHGLLLRWFLRASDLISDLGTCQQSPSDYTSCSWNPEVFITLKCVPCSPRQISSHHYFVIVKIVKKKSNFPSIPSPFQS